MNLTKLRKERSSVNVLGSCHVVSFNIKSCYNIVYSAETAICRPFIEYFLYTLLLLQQPSDLSYRTPTTFSNLRNEKTKLLLYNLKQNKSIQKSIVWVLRITLTSLTRKIKHSTSVHSTIYGFFFQNFNDDPKDAPPLNNDPLLFTSLSRSCCAAELVTEFIEIGLVFDERGIGNELGA